MNSQEEHLLSVRDTKRHTLFAEDVVSLHTTSKSLDALLADILMPKWEDVIIIFCMSTHLIKINCFKDDGWGQKVRDRKGQGTGRMRYMKTIARRAKNGFRSGTTA